MKQIRLISELIHKMLSLTQLIVALDEVLKI